MMNRNRLSALVLMIVLGALPMGVAAQLPDSTVILFDFSGSGNMELMSPPVFSGTIDSGDPLVVGGTWWSRIDDTGWPSTADPAARWNYILTHFLTYDPNSHSWTGVFNEVTCATRPVWHIDALPNGTMDGTLAIVVTFTDDNFNGVLDTDERITGVYSGTLIVMKYGTGMFAGYCGLGAYNGLFWNDDPGNWADDNVQGSCKLDLKNCAIGVKQMTWGGIKNAYR
jgi:hypothetical protein